MVTEVVSIMMWNASIQLRRCQVKTVNIYLKRLCAQGFTVKSACHFWPWNVPLHWVGVTPLTLVGGEVSVGVILEAIRASFKHLFKVVIQWLSRVLLCDPTDSSMPGFPALLYLQEFVQLMPTELMMPSNHLFLFCPLLLQPSIFPRIRVFFNELTFPMGDQTIEASASASVLPMNIQNWFPLGLTGLISLLSKRLKSLVHHSSKAGNIGPRRAGLSQPFVSRAWKQTFSALRLAGLSWLSTSVRHVMEAVTTDA